MRLDLITTVVMWYSRGELNLIVPLLYWTVWMCSLSLLSLLMSGPLSTL